MQVSGLCVVNAANSKGVTSANVTRPGTGRYCFTGLAGSIRGIQATVDFNDASGDESAQAGLGDTPACPAGTQGFVRTYLGDGTGTPDDAGTFVVFYK